MTGCYYCHGMILDGQKLSFSGDHKMCSDEWSRRYDNNKCVRCNKDVKLLESSCSDCLKTNAVHIGYDKLGQ